MTQKNCLNCGAPYDINENKCPYCGTSYYDLSALDLSNNEPCYLKIKINHDGKNIFITQLVKPSFGEMKIITDYQDCYTKNGIPIMRLEKNTNLTTTITITAIPDAQYNLVMIEKA